MADNVQAPREITRHPDTRWLHGEEVEAQRNENSKTFALGKGLFQTVVYPERVHYQDTDGAWCEIDNRLNTAANGEQALETVCDPMRTRLALVGDANPLITITNRKGQQVSWALDGAGSVACTQGEYFTPSDDEDENRAHADKSTSAVRYHGILPDTDLICELQGDMLKESLVLHSQEAPTQYRFTLNIDSLAWVQTEDGYLRLWDSATPEEDAFLMPRPYMVDALGAGGELRTEWQMTADGLTMTLTPDAGFLAAARYPVIIDPTVQSSQTATNILDTFISETNNTTNYSTAQTLRIGKHSTYGQCRSLVKITALPALTSAYTVAKAWLQLAVLPTASNTEDTCLYAHAVQESWVQTATTWDNQPKYDEKHLDYQLLKKGESAATSAYVDITNLVRKWYASSDDNLGVLLEADDAQPIELCASENTAYTSTARPLICVNYMSNTGLESYLSYESFGAGRAGTAHMALHNGHLVVARGLTAMNGNRMPVSLGLTWNLCNMNDNLFGLGNGWRLNWNQSLRREKPATGDYYYILTDGDGTEHEFRKHELTTAEQADTSFVNYYADQSGLSLKLYEGTTESEIVSKDHDKLVFDKPTTDYAGTRTAATVKMIKRVLDALEKTATFTHDASFRLTQATDGAGRVTTLAYTDTEVRVTVPGYAQQAVLTLDASHRLTMITDLDGLGSVYAYGEEPDDESEPDATLANRLKLLHNTVNGTCVHPVYDERSRVTQMKSYALDTVDDGLGGTTEVHADGNSHGYTYYDCVTQVKDLTVTDGKVLTYQFNDYGNVVAVHDELGFASFAKFAMGKPNTPEAVSKLQRLVVNLLDMHHFTEDGGWTSGVIGTDGITREMDVAISGLKPLCLECPAPKWLTQGEIAYAEYLKACDAGEYTFSVSTKSQGDVLAWAELAWQDSNDLWYTVASEQVRRVGSRLRLTCTVKLPQAATLRCRVLAGDGTGAAWFDEAQLETGALASRHNMLQNGNFTELATGEFPDGWIYAEADDETADEEKVTLAAAEASDYKPKNLGDHCLRFQGAPDRKISVYQELVIRGKKSDSYVVGGWARGWAAPSGDGRTFRLRVQFQKKNGLWADGGTANWNEEWVDWQYACGAAVAPADYRKLRVYIDYDANLNEAQIGAVSLTKEYYGQNFAYDEDNNITAVSTLLGEKDKAEYDKFDNLTSYVQPGRDEADKYTFFYGDTDAQKKKHLPLKSVTPLGLTAETEYDAYGNATRNTARDAVGGWFMRTGATYTADGNYAAGATDSLGQNTSVEIDPNKGLTLSATDVTGQQVTYQYDAANRVTSAQTAVGEGTEAVTYRNAYTYEKDRLKTVSHNTSANTTEDVTYTFETDALGNQTVVKVGDQPLSANAYTATGDKLLQSVTYANGGKVSYTYDSFKRTSGIGYDGATEPRFTYEYGANGAVGRVKDAELNREARVAYDLVDRPVEAELYENGALQYRLTQEYDRFEQPTVLRERVEAADNTRSEYTVTVSYDKESRPTALTCESSLTTAAGVADVVSKRKLVYRYDRLGRVVGSGFCPNANAAGTASETPLFQTEYGFAMGGYGENSTTPRVQSIKTAGQTFEYEYDAQGNIIREIRQGKASAGGNLSYESASLTSEDGDPLTLDAALLETRYETTYAYDALGQLLRVNDQLAGTTCTYAYDLGGNMLEKKRYAYTTAADLSAVTPEQTVPYAYADPNWKDKLTSYDGHAVTCDAIGNPLTYDGWAYSWKAGRMLESMTSADTTAQFTYDHTGLRVKKSVGGVDTLYTLNGKRITGIRKGTNNATGEDAVEMHFFYDAQGKPMLVRYMDTDYAYLHNLQGDVVGILDMNGASVVEYGYDAWGMPTYTKGSMAETLGADNPFRYRGYVWDEETGLYYLRSRYYNPGLGRFVNADTYAQNGYDLFSSNMFGYCQNNPVANADIDGDVPYPAYIHNEITRYITSIYPNIKAEVGFYKANGRIGRADLIDLDEGEVWELKPASASFTIASRQLESYINGQIMTDENAITLGGKSLRPGRAIDSGRFTDHLNLYDIYYWYESEGIIRYSFTARTSLEPSPVLVPKPTTKEARSPAQSSVSAGNGSKALALWAAILGACLFVASGGMVPAF